MKHRISAGAIVIHEQKILLVNHKKDGHYDFWVAPGGGVKGTETTEQTAIREVKEETGLDISVLKLAYIEELFNSEVRLCKFWYLAKFLGGEFQIDQESKSVEYIVEAQFKSRDELANETVFPKELNDQIWLDIEEGFSSPKYIGLREMEFC